MEYFENSPQVEQEWLAYCAKLKALSNWTKYVGYPFGMNEAGEFHFSLSRGKENAILHQDWLAQQQKRTGYADPAHPFRYQGSADINTYKMFAELAHALLKTGGRFSLITPSGIYTDKGTGQLRKLFLNQCEWTHLYAFQNERFVFSSVHHSYKVAILTINKSGRTKSVLTRFRLGTGGSPNAEEMISDITSEDFLAFPFTSIEKFSPITKAILEIRSEKNREIIEKIYSNGVTLGDQSIDSWSIKYSTDFHMTSDSQLFSPLSTWEAKEYKPDQYGHWLKGNWQLLDDKNPPLNETEKFIYSRDCNYVIKASETEDIALPMYVGKMIEQFDSCSKGWVTGRGRRAIWRILPFQKKQFEPEFLMSLKDFKERVEFPLSTRIGLIDITTSVHHRTGIFALLPEFPCANSLPILSLESNALEDALLLVAVLNSFVFDIPARYKLAYLHLSWFILEELALPKRQKIKSKNLRFSLSKWSASLGCIQDLMSRTWIDLSKSNPCIKKISWFKLLAITDYERLRLRCILDSVIADLYNLSTEDFAWILQDCDHSIERLKSQEFVRTLEPKGFWRVDRDKNPELVTPSSPSSPSTKSNKLDSKPSSTSTTAKAGCFPKLCDWQTTA